MLRLIDKLSDAFGRLAASMFFVVGGMITYEVVARYVFTAPTIWAEEMSRFVQIWATYLAAAYVLRQRRLIAITLVVDRLGPVARRLVDGFALISVAGFALVAIWYGLAIAVDSFVVGRASSTMLALPLWWSEMAVPVGFAILFLQCLVELARLAAADGERLEERR
jgi:TRAP-type C4-dicarboxylate transport system permease small subunit